jgi:Tol biopolymer transport system component
VIFASNRDRVANTGQIYAVRPDGKEIRRLTRGIRSHAQPRVTGAGDRMLVAEGLEQGEFETYHIASFAFPASSE